MKIQLPERIDKQHHVLFTFYHVTCKPTSGKADSSSAAKVIGYAWIPLNRIQRQASGEHVLPVAQELPHDYNTAKVEDLKTAKWLDQGKPLFKVRIKLDSTVLSDDLYLQVSMIERGMGRWG